VVAQNQSLAAPVVFDEPFGALPRGHDDVWSEAAGLEPSLGIELLQPVNRCGRKDVNMGRVEEEAARHRLVRDRVAVGKVIHIRPVFLQDRLAWSDRKSVVEGKSLEMVS